MSDVKADSNDGAVASLDVVSAGGDDGGSAGGGVVGSGAGGDVVSVAGGDVVSGVDGDVVSSARRDVISGINGNVVSAVGGDVVSVVGGDVVSGVDGDVVSPDGCSASALAGTPITAIASIAASINFFTSPPFREVLYVTGTFSCPSRSRILQKDDLI